MVTITKALIENWLNDGTKLGEEEIPVLKEFVEKFPFYPAAQIVLTKAYFNTNNQFFEKQLRKASLLVDNRLWLYNYVHQQSNVEFKPADIGFKIEIKKAQGEVLNVDEEVELNILDIKKPKLVIADEAAFEPKDAENIEESEPLNEVLSAITANVQIDELQQAEIIEEQSKDITLIKEELLIEEITNADTLPQIETDKEEVSFTNNETLNFLDWLDYTSFNKNTKSTSIVSEISDNENAQHEIPTVNNSVEKTAEILEKFLANKPKPGEVRPTFYNPEKMSEQSDLADNILVSETLARVYLDQGAPEMALSVYEKLALKNPQKNTYFAALIKELKEKHNL